MEWFRQKRVLVQILIGGIGIVIAGAIFIFNIFTSLPAPGEINDIQVSQSTKIYDRGGNTLLYEIYGEEKRTIVPPGDIPDIVRHATISIEDDSFYAHPAFDLRGIFRALIKNIVRGGVVQGGSTITQQLAKNAFLSQERTITRKLRELVLAMRLEQRYTKDEILNLYLNQVPYGSNTYGVEAASQTFFKKHASELSISEAALLAALPQSPSYYSPWGTHLNELEKRWLFVLKRMRELGYIDEGQLSEASESFPEIAPQPEEGIQAPHFVIFIQDYLREKYGEDALRNDGFRVTTTLDKDLQKIAEEAVKTGVQRNSELYGGENGALLAMDPQTGQILAMVGSKDYFSDPVPDGCSPGKNCKFEGNFNVATQGLRQPGSALKPFAYITAFQKGFTPETIIWDVPTEFAPACPAIVNFQNHDTRCYHPQNFDSFFRGPVMMKEALAQSINVPAVKTLYLAGLSDTLKNASLFGISTLNDPSRFGLSLVLGGGEIRLIELVGAYGVLAADGIKHEPTAILKIEDGGGNVLEEYKDSSERVIEPQYTRLINDILSNVSLRAPLYQSSLALTQVSGHQVALKTGTTNDYVDAWTFGYTPNLVAGVWAGNNNRDPLTSRGSSVLAAVPMWHYFMSRALEGKPLTTFQQPDPTPTDNPALRGELVEGSFRSILYYLGRIGDPQFSHWETGVSYWLQYNSVDTSKFNIVSADSVGGAASNPSGGSIDLSFTSPKNGSFVGDVLNVRFSVNSERDIEKVEVYLNDALIDSLVGGLGKKTSYQKEIKSSSLGLQNLITVRVLDEGGLRAEKGVIVFK